MTAAAIVLVVVGVVVLALVLGGFAFSRRRLRDPQLLERIRSADQELEQARATDRGWDRVLLEQVARRSLGDKRPEFAIEELHLVLVDDRPGVEEDRAHMLAVGGRDQARVVLMRDAGGDWLLEHIE